jgi:hypothetical protein
VLKTGLVSRVKRNECCRAVYDVGCVWGNFTGSAIEGLVKPCGVNNSKTGLVKPCDVNYSKTVLVIICHTDRITMVGASVVSQILHGTLPDVPYKAYMAYWAEYRFGARGAAPCTCQVRCRQFPRRIDFATSRKFRIFGPA